MIAMYFLRAFGIIAFLGLVAIFELKNRNGKDAPYVPTEVEVAKHIVKLCGISKGDVFYDLGSGDGRLVITAALRGAKAYGIELSRFKVWYSRLWIRFLGLSKNAEIINKDIFETDLRDANVVCLYLLQETNHRLEGKLKKELRKGTRIVSVAFTLPSFKLIKTDPRGPIYGPIYLYEV